MSKVFVWKSYGDISVYSSDNPNLKQAVIEVLEYRQADLPANPTWNDLLDLIESEIVSRSNSFEYGTGFYEIGEN